MIPPPACEKQTYTVFWRVLVVGLSMKFEHAELVVFEDRNTFGHAFAFYGHPVLRFRYH